VSDEDTLRTASFIAYFLPSTTCAHGPVAARQWRRLADLRELPQALLGPDLEAPRPSAATPRSARHSFISTLHAQGVEVGLVAKLAGHKSAVVTLSHYTHAMLGGEDAVKALDRAYAGSAS
jgi:integrase